MVWKDLDDSKEFGGLISVWGSGGWHTNQLQMCVHTSLLSPVRSIEWHALAITDYEPS